MARKDDVIASGTAIFEVQEIKSAGSTTTGTFKMKSTDTLLAERGLNPGGRVQKFIDSEVLRRTDPYVPMDTGALKRSGIQHTKVGSGEVIYKTPYARRQYFTNQGDGLRGSRWFERMKADNKKSILDGAKKMSGK